MIYKPTWNKFYSLDFVFKGMHFFVLHFSKQFFIPPSFRPLLLRFCGVKFKNSKTVFIGTDVLFDNLKNTTTTIGDNVVITSGTKIINHYPIISKDGVKEYNLGDIIIEDNVFIGMNSLIIRPIKIGKGAIIGAGSVINKNVPQEAIVVGNPFRIIGYTTD